MMTMLKDLAAELFGMFFAESWLALSVLALVAVTGVLIDFAGTDRLVGGAILLFGSLILVVASICNAARARAS
ncbi:MAG: hypothetical protein JO212_10890 [Acetobacteraceae bacterium]|nr:hypothetical protein [Acetobacteraceae bacterium]